MSRFASLARESGPDISEVRPVPRYALTVQEAADAIGVSLSTYSALAAEGRVPKPFPVPGHPKLVRVDPDDVRNAVREWKERANLDTDGGWGNVR